jgi:hypothetical protein
MLLVLEEKLGLAELHRDALKSFIETIFTDPQKILQVKDLDNRVRKLEKQNGRLWAALGIEGGPVSCCRGDSARSRVLIALTPILVALSSVRGGGSW